MADTSFSGSLMGLNDTAFNPCYKTVTSMKMNIPALTDSSVIDYLVHGKPEPTRDVPSFVDRSLSYIPYEIVKPVEPVHEPIVDDGIVRTNKLNRKWYDAKTWNKIMVAMSHKLHATCSITHVPLYNVIHNAPTRNETFDAAVFDFPVKMVETVPLTVKSVKHTVFIRDDSHDNMDYDAAYWNTTGKTRSPFFGLSRVETMYYKLDLIGESVVDKLNPSDPRPDDWDDWKRVNDEPRSYEKRILESAARVDEYARNNRQTVLYGWSYKMAMDESGLTDAFYETDNAFVFNEFVKSTCNEHYTVDEMNALATRSIYSLETDVIDDNNRYRAGHWLNGDVVETRAPENKPTVFGASVLNLYKPRPIRDVVNMKFPITTVVGSYDVFGVDGFNWNLVFNDTHGENVKFGTVNMTTFKLSNTGAGLHHHVKRVAKMTSEIDVLKSFLTSEPMLVNELTSLTGISSQKLTKILTTAAKSGIVKTATIKNKSTAFRPRAAFYL